MEDKYEMKRRAEALYVEAIKLQEQGVEELAKSFGRECRDIYRRIGDDTLDDVATTRVQIDGVYLPNHLYAAIVEKKFGLND